ncbi:hypothetical protein LIS91_08370 [Flavobacterium psychrophilum]|uniref:hypothetical protein n=1 Tax=Flavobacterium psychrophilum TaxID=96345 RepID=UPI000A692654|nr:hypothetical protein [Flavobacterium psychrophilum]MCB6012085.1 hypothetical protein [Flavobacterium psychrophilum]
MLIVNVLNCKCAKRLLNSPDGVKILAIFLGEIVMTAGLWFAGMPKWFASEGYLF